MGLLSYLKSIPARLDPRLCVTRENINNLIEAANEHSRAVQNFVNVVCELQNARIDDDNESTRLMAALVLRLGDNVLLSNDLLNTTFGADYCEVIRRPDDKNDGLVLSVTFDSPEDEFDGEV